MSTTRSGIVQLLGLALLASLPAAGASGELRGEVRGADTRVVPQAIVVALRQGEDRAVVALTSTDGEGLFRLDDLPPGRYRVLVTAPGAPRVELDGVEVQPPFRAVVDLVLDGRRAGAPVERPIMLGGPEQGPARVRIRVVGSDGAPLEKAWVRLAPVGHRANPLVLRSDEQGSAESGPIPTGAYRVTAGRAGHLTLDAGVLSWSGGVLAVLVRLEPVTGRTRPRLEALLPPPRFLPPPASEPAGEKGPPPDRSAPAVSGPEAPRSSRGGGESPDPSGRERAP